MILSPIPDDRLDIILAEFACHLGPRPLVRAAWTRIVASRQALLHPDEPRWHADAVTLAKVFGMAPLAEEPAHAFSWDGTHVRTLTEPAVLLHEVAHYQLASPARRALPDFGLGAGPESGFAAIAEAARCVGDCPRETEEQLASLLGILWETELGQPGILAFMEQNWLEGAGRASVSHFFETAVSRLHDRGLIDENARPLITLSILADDKTERLAA